MQMLHEMVREDMSNTFADTYLLATRGTEKSAVYVYGFPDEEYAEVRWLDSDEGATICIDRLSMGNTDLGMYVEADTLYYISRRAERQWRRGLRSSTLHAYILTKEGRAILTHVGGDFCNRIAEHFLNKKKPHTSVLSRDFALSGEVLFFRSLPVGRLLPNNTIALTTKLTLPEIEGFTYA